MFSFPVIYQAIKQNPNAVKTGLTTQFAIVFCKNG